MKLSRLTVSVPPDPNWRAKAKLFEKLRPITKADLKHGTNSVQFITPQEIFNGPTGLVVRFGKYSGKTKEWIKEHDINYYKWAEENVKNF